MPGATMAIRIERSEKPPGGVAAVENCYWLTNSDPVTVKPAAILKAARAHWMVESFHWHKDTVWREDQRRSKGCVRGTILSWFTSLAANVIQRADGVLAKLPLRAKVKACGYHPELALIELRRDQRLCT